MNLLIQNDLIMDVLISIITTVRNGEEYIYDTLHSVYLQTYKSYEHVIINDGSTDDTLIEIERFQSDYSENKIVVKDTPGIGRGKALNLGVRNAKGDWIAIIDADDLWHPEKLSVQIDVLSRKQTKVLATESISFTGAAPRDHLYDEYVTKCLRIEDFLDVNPVCHSSIILKKDLCVYEEGRESQFDLELWLRLLDQGHGIDIVKQPMTYHRKHDNQSFEAKLGWKMTFNSFKLKASYSLKNRKLIPLIKNTLRLVYVAARTKMK